MHDEEILVAIPDQPFDEASEDSYVSHSAGGIVINPQGLVALVNQGGVSWSFPKGHLESGETPLEAATREIFEETGIDDLRLVRELGSYVRTSNQYAGEEIIVVNKKITLFIFETSYTELRPQDPMIPEAVWVSKEMVAELLSHPKDKDSFEGIELL